MAVAKLDAFDQVFSNVGTIGAGYKIQTYAGGTTTPLASYADSAGTPNANPVVADSAGRFELWLTVGLAYKLVLMTVGDVPIETVDNVTIASGGTVTNNTFFDIEWFYAGGPPTSGELIYAVRLARAVNFPANYTGSFGVAPSANPNAERAIVVSVNDVTKGTITIATSGAYAFATSAGAAMPCAAGDTVKFTFPAATETSLANFGATLAGSLA